MQALGRRRAKAIVVRLPNLRAYPSLHLRLDFSGERSLGPGKVQLLELVKETGSISAPGRALKMSYRQAWTKLDEANRMFRQPLIIAQCGGGGGGGAALTKEGARVVQAYRDMEKRAGTVALSDDVRALVKMLA